MGRAWRFGTKKMPPLSVGDKVFVQNQTGRAPNKWDKSGVIVECKPHDQVNVMMDGSRKVSLRNRRFVRKIDIPMQLTAGGIKPSQFYSQPDLNNRVNHDVVPERVGGEDSPDVARMDDQVNHDDGALAMNQDNAAPIDRVQDTVPETDGSARDAALDQQPVARPQRLRRPNSKYDPSTYDLDSIGIRTIPLSGKKNGWKGIFWPQ